MNRIIKLLGIKYPFIQAPMLGVTSPEMVSAVCSVGALGSLPLGGLSPEESLKLIKRTKELIKDDKVVFSVNLFAYQPVQVVAQLVKDQAKEKENLNLIGNRLQSFMNYKKEYDDTDYFGMVTTTKYYSGDDLVDVLIDQNIKIVSFTFGILSSQSINRLKENGCVLMGTATSVEEALYLERQGISCIVAQGYEAGGHRGTFLTAANTICHGGNMEYNEIPKITTMALLPMIRDRVSKDTLVVAAGGLVDGKTCAAALGMGADAVQLGTVFLASKESIASDSYKSLVLQSSTSTSLDFQTRLTRAFSGRWARGFVNRYMQLVELDTSLVIPPYPIQLKLTSTLRTQNQAQTNQNFISLWAGQNTTKCTSLSSFDILNNIINDTTNLSSK